LPRWKDRSIIWLQLLDWGLYQSTVSINILTKSDTGFRNILIPALFNCMRFVWNIAYFTVMTNEFINKRVGSDVCQRTRELHLPEQKILINKIVGSYVCLRTREWRLPVPKICFNGNGSYVSYNSLIEVTSPITH